MDAYSRKPFRSIDQQAEEISRVIEQLAIQEGITEELKATDQIAWVGAMNSIRQRAREIVNSELISNL